jgi:hypothetical protein
MLIFEGTNEILRALIALSGLQQPGEQLKELGKAFRDPLHSLGAIGTYIAGRVKRQLVKPEFTRVHEALKGEAEMVARAVHRLALAVEKLLVAHGKDVIERQFHQERLANAAIDIFLATATLSRATWAVAKAGSVEDPPPTSTTRASSSRWRCATRRALPRWNATRTLGRSSWRNARHRNVDGRHAHRHGPCAQAGARRLARCASAETSDRWPRENNCSCQAHNRADAPKPDRSHHGHASYDDEKPIRHQALCRP